MLKILEPITIGGLTCRNRILMGAHSPGHVDNNGLPTDALGDYLQERAKGGIGLLIMGGTSISKEGALVERIALNIDDAIVPRYQRIADKVHSYGALVFEQLMHVGGQLDAYEGSRIVAPSSIPHELTRSVPLELSTTEIADITREFADASLRVKLGGLDGVEIKCDQGFLIHQFLSPYYNRRTDSYGGSFSNRLRFLREVIRQVRDAVGTDYAVGIRITGDSLTRGDFTLQDTLQIIEALSDPDLIDFIHVNGSTNSTYIGYLIGHGDSSISQKNFVSFAKAVKSIVDIPVIAGSMVMHPHDAEEIISSGSADMVSMTRAHIADPEIINKLQAGRVDDIRPCVLTNQSCVGNHWVGQDVHCIHNPSAGRERELGIGTLQRVSSEGKRSIAVVGGGVAGMEFARVAAIRGHKVELYERERKLGGQVLLASEIPYRQGLLDVAHYLERQITAQSNVKIHRGIEINEQDLSNLEEDYDWVVLAVGSEPYIPPIFGAIDRSKLIHVRDILSGRIQPMNNVLVIDIDWRQNALGTAELLARQSQKVTIISTAFFIGERLDACTLASYYSRLNRKVDFLPLTALDSYENDTAVLRNVLTNELFELHPIEQVICVSGSSPRKKLFSSIRDKLLMVGDCDNPLGIPEAIVSANRLARQL